VLLSFTYLILFFNNRYTCGGAAIVYKSGARSQNVYNGNESAINTLASTTDGRFAATCNSSGTTKVIDSVSGVEVSSLGGVGASVVGCAFNNSGNMLATVSDDVDHTLSIYITPNGSWRDGVLFSSSSNVTAAVAFVCWGNDDSIVSGGFNHVMFWTLCGGNLSCKKGVFGENGQIQPMTCGVGSSNGSIVTGSVGGSLFVWDVATASVVETKPGHTKCVTSISGGDGGFVTSGKDGFVKIWSNELMNLNAFDMGSPVWSAGGDTSGSKVLCGLASGELKEIVVDSEFSSVIVESHRNVYGKLSEDGGE